MIVEPVSRERLDAHGREVIRECLNIIEQHGDTYVAIHRDSEVECVIVVSVLRAYPLLSITVADKLLLSDRNENQVLRAVNDMNLGSVTGWHTIRLEDNSMVYMYRQCVWISMSLTYDELFGILKACMCGK